MLQNLLSNVNLHQATLTQACLPSCVPSAAPFGKGAVSLPSLPSPLLTQQIAGLTGMCCAQFFSGHVLGPALLCETTCAALCCLPVDLLSVSAH